MNLRAKDVFRTILTVSAVSLLILSGCGGDDGGDSDDGALKSAMNEWAATDTPGSACARMASGFRFFVGDGDGSLAACKEKIASVMGPIEAAETVEIGDISFEDGQAEVVATVDGTEQSYWFIEQDGEWLLNSIGARQGEGPAPGSPPPPKGGEGMPPPPTE